MPANAADLLPPSPPSYLSPPAPRHLPTPSRGDTSVHGDGFAGENALQTFLGRSVTFSTDPSGVIGGAKFGSDYQFSPADSSSQRITGVRWFEEQGAVCDCGA